MLQFLFFWLVGAVLTVVLFNLFVFLEVAAVASYGLVAFGMEKHALEAAFKYAVMGSVGSLCILLGIAMLYATTSTLNMADMARVLAMNEPGALTAFVTVLFLMGFGMKGACLLYTSDAADDLLCVDLGGRPIIQKKKKQHQQTPQSNRNIKTCYCLLEN